VNPDCVILSSVSHVTHVDGALEILRADSIKPKLIYDESRLNTQRVLVVWLSPNDWRGAGGFRYGNIAFDLDWETLIAGKRFYWIGAIPYKPHACRILITEQDYDDELKIYHPERGDGPWVTNVDEHHWTGEYCLEFMLEDEIPLSTIIKMRFVDHHRNRCSIDPARCRDCGHSAARGAARLLAGACARRLLAPGKRVWKSRGGGPKQCLRDAWRALSERVSYGIRRWDRLVKRGTERVAAVARAGMGAYCDMSVDDRKQLFGLFHSSEAAIDACAEVIEDDLDLATGSLPRSYDDED